MKPPLRVWSAASYLRHTDGWVWLCTLGGHSPDLPSSGLEATAGEACDAARRHLARRADRWLWRSLSESLSITP